MASVRSGRAIALAVALVLAAPAVGEADHVFSSGGFEGKLGHGRKLTFAADHSGVHAFSTRVKLSCRNGAKRTVRVSVPHIGELDNATGYFSYDRGSKHLASARARDPRRRGRERDGVPAQGPVRGQAQVGGGA